MNHSFNIAVAAEYGILEAVLLEYLNFWVTKNKANGVQYYDGYYWTYNSTKALAELFPYASKTTIYRALRHLEDEGLVLSGNYNKAAYDRTMWYTLAEKGSLLLDGKDGNKQTDCVCQDNIKNEKTIFQDEQSIVQDEKCMVQNEKCMVQNEKCMVQNEKCIVQNEKCMVQNEKCIVQNDKMHFSKCENGFTQNEPTIPVINTVIDTDINTDIDTVNNLTVSKDTVCRTYVQRITERWNSLAQYGIKPVNSITPKTKRYDMLKARIRSYGIDNVLLAIENIKNSAFLCGSGQKGWTITFDWFVRPNNFIKVLEGNYNNSSLGTQQTADTGQQIVNNSGYPQELLDMLAGEGSGVNG